MIIYIHGYNSSGNSKTASMIREHFKDLVSVTWDTNKPKHSIEEIIKLIDNADDDEEVILVASSLGGFIAEAISDRRRVGLVLINPSLVPYQSLRKYNLDEATLDEYDSIQLKFRKEHRSIILSMDDNVVNPENALQIYSKIAKVIKINGGHQVTKEMIPIITQEINNTINSLYD